MELLVASHRYINEIQMLGRHGCFSNATEKQPIARFHAARLIGWVQDQFITLLTGVQTGPDDGHRAALGSEERQSGMSVGKVDEHRDDVASITNWRK